VADLDHIVDPDHAQDLRDGPDKTLNLRKCEQFLLVDIFIHLILFGDVSTYHFKKKEPKDQDKLELDQDLDQDPEKE
jgi:hypothetical protein